MLQCPINEAVNRRHLTTKDEGGLSFTISRIGTEILRSLQFNEFLLSCFKKGREIVGQGQDYTRVKYTSGFLSRASATLT